MRVLINVIDAAGVETGTAADDDMDGVVFSEKQLAEVGAILARDTRDESGFIQRTILHNDPFGV